MIDTHVCRKCRRYMRNYDVKSHEMPGTVLRAAGGICLTCKRKGVDVKELDEADYRPPTHRRAEWTKEERRAAIGVADTVHQEEIGFFLGMLGLVGKDGYTQHIPGKGSLSHDSLVTKRSAGNGAMI